MWMALAERCADGVQDWREDQDGGRDEGLVQHEGVPVNIRFEANMMFVDPDDAGVGEVSDLYLLTGDCQVVTLLHPVGGEYTFEHGSDQVLAELRERIAIGLLKSEYLQDPLARWPILIERSK
jgi:hypothetical protein